jgi:FixJ family two-component response regulator
MPPKRPIIHVIDDDTSFRRSIARLLTAVGYEVDTFSSADQYLATADGEGCLVLDVHMPGKSGLDLVDDLNQHGHHPPVVFVTADDTPGVAERASRAGAVALLTKPVQPSALLEAIGQAPETVPADPAV